jgi:hypothetical protein
MNVQPFQSNPTNVAQSEVAETIETTGNNSSEAILEELMRRLGPRIMDRITELINEALACKCCS